MDALDLESLEEAFRAHAVPSIAFPVHRHDGGEPAVFIAGVLTTTIRMYDKAELRCTLPIH
jgi:hypothetical protein